MDLWQACVLVAGGFVCGVINAASGGGSFVTLPLLLWAGLPPQIANATNRVSIVLQCATGMATFHQHRVRPWRHLAGIIPFAVAGSIAGTLLASRVNETVFRWAAAVLMLAMVFTIFIKPERWMREHGEGRVRLAHMPMYFLISVYGGFLQAGVGVIMLGAFVLVGGFDVVRGNALKFGLNLIFTAVALLLFAQAGQVQWGPGLFLAAGSMVGGAVGARMVILKGAQWVRYLVILGALAAVIKLLRG